MWTAIIIGVLFAGGVAYFIKVGRKLEDSDDARNTVGKMADIQKSSAEIDQDTKDRLAERAWERRQGKSGDIDSVGDVFPSLSDRE